MQLASDTWIAGSQDAHRQPSFHRSCWNRCRRLSTQHTEYGVARFTLFL